MRNPVKVIWILNLVQGAKQSIMKKDIKINNQISATLITPKKIPKPLPALLFIHGWRSNRTGNVKRAKELAKHGFISLCIDLRGHGESPTTSLQKNAKQSQKLEDFSRKDHIEDIKNAYQYLKNLENVDKEKIGIIGASYGGYLSAVAVNYLKFNKLVLRVPALYFDNNFDVPTDKLIKGDPKAFKTSNLTPQNSLALKGLKNFKGKILIIEAENDTVIPHEVIENYRHFTNPKKNKYVLMSSTPHSFETEAQEEAYLYILKHWLD